MPLFVYSLVLIFSILFSIASPYAHGQTSAAEQADGANKKPTDEKVEVRWVSDDLFTYLRAGPGKDYRLLGSVTAGTKIQLLQTDREAGYAEIIDDRQRTGWIEIMFVSRTQSIRDDNSDLQAIQLEKDQSIANMQMKVDEVTKSFNKFDAQKAKLNRQITQQLEDIARLNEQLEKRERANNMLWFTRGATLGVIALIIGYIMGLFGRKRKVRASDRIM